MTRNQAKRSLVIWVVMLAFGAYQLGMNSERHVQWQLRGLVDDHWRMDLAAPLIWMFGAVLHLAWNWHRTTVEPPPKAWKVPSRLLMMASIAAVGGGLWFWGRGTVWTYAQAAVYPGIGCAVAGVIMDRIGK